MPGQIGTTLNGQLRVQVFPTRGLYDSVLFAGFRADVWMQPGVTRDNLNQHMACYVRPGTAPAGIALVLGAGNVSSIAPTDAFSKLFQEGKVVLLKMNPVNEYLGGIFSQAFRALVEEGFLRIIYGGAGVGTYAVEHELVDEVHITGSIYSHETIVWGPPGAGARPPQGRGIGPAGKAHRQRVGQRHALDRRAGPVHRSRVDVSGRERGGNDHQQRLVQLHRHEDDRYEPRSGRDRQQISRQDRSGAGPHSASPRLLPGAEERVRPLHGTPARSRTAGDAALDAGARWQPDQDPQYFNEESFVCVCAETALDAAHARGFLEQVARLRQRLDCGATSGPASMMHPRFRRRPGGEDRLQMLVGKLRFGTIGINHWPAISYALCVRPGADFPEGTLEDPKSGLGWVHNTYLLDAAQKTVIEGPLTMMPKPFWFPTHRTANILARKTVDLTYRPGWWKLPGLMLPALRG